MKSTPRQYLLAAALIGALAFTTAQAQQYPIPTTAAEVPGPAAGNTMTKQYVQMVGRMAYFWGWPLAANFNRSVAFSKAPEPGLIGGVVPIAYGGIAMLTDYVTPDQRVIACANQDVVYGIGFLPLDKEPFVLQIPDFGERFWVYALYDARTDEFSAIGKAYGTKPGFYLIVGPDWKGETPAGITAVVRSSTALAFAVPRIFMDNTAEDRKAIQPVLSGINVYPLSQFDGTIKTKDWSKLLHYPAPKSDGKGETKWVNPETFFDELPALMKQVPPLPGEESLYKWISSVLEAADKDPAVKQTLKETAVAADAMITPFLQWRYNGRAAGNGWNSPVNNARWGTDYLNRTGTAKSNIYDNRPEETKYIYTDDDSQGQQLDGRNLYTVIFAKGQTPPVKGFWSLTLYNAEHFFNTNPLNRYSLGTKNKTLKYNADGSLTLYAGAKSPGADKESNWLPAPNGTFSLYIRAYWPDQAVLDGTWQPPAVALAPALQAQESRYDELAKLPFKEGYVPNGDVPTLLDELFFERAVQTYLWALPALNMYGMKEGSEKVFGKGYNVLPMWKQRLNAKTLITTPNSDVIYAMGYLDLKEDGPVVIEVPPGLQGIIDDFWQRPIPTVGEIEGRMWSGDVGLPGPDRGKGGKYLILPPDYAGEVPPGYFTYRSGTYGVFVFWRGFFKDPRQLEEPVRVMEQTRIYPLGKRETAKPMQFPDASGVPANMLYPEDGTAFDMLARFIDHEYVDPAQMYMRGMAAELGIVKGQPFAPDAPARALLDKAARAAFRMAHAEGYTPSPLVKNGRYWPDRQWVNVFPGNATFTSDSFDYINARTTFFTYAYATSPGMAVNMVNVGAKYPFTFYDADGDYLDGGQNYKLHVPKDVPVALFWSVTVYDPITASGLDNGQPFPSINSMDRPVQNTDGTFDIYFGPKSPGEGNNWLATVPGKGWFTIFRLYGPKQAFFDRTWTLNDIEKVK